MTLDHPSGPNVKADSLYQWKGGAEEVKWLLKSGQRDTAPLVLKRGKGHGQGMQVALEGGKGKEMDSQLKPQER